MLIYWELQESSDNLEEYNGQTVNKSVAQFVEDNSEFTLYDVPEDYPDLETEFEGTEADLPITIVVEGQPMPIISTLLLYATRQMQVSSTISFACPSMSYRLALCSAKYMPLYNPIAKDITSSDMAASYFIT